MILDVGVGGQPKGDVNVDLYRVTAEYELGRLTPIPKCENFVLASVEFLPFKPDTFEFVRCTHLLEHIRKPQKGIAELLRVSKNRVFIKVPSRWHKYARSPYHLWSFRSTWFNKVAAMYGVRCEVRVTRRHAFWFLPLPNEIVVKLWKNRI